MRRAHVDSEEERRKRDEAQARHRRDRLKGHVVAAAVVFSLTQILYGLITAVGLVSTIVSAIVMAPLGAVTGYFISTRRLGLAGGTAAGALVVGLAMLLILLVLGKLGAASLLYVVAGGAVSGGIPGFFAAFHVSVDN